MILGLVPQNKIKKEEIEFSFNFFDKDNSSKISFNEFYEILQKHGVNMKAVSRKQMSKTFVYDNIK